MKYIITRASASMYDQPCDEAFECSHKITDKEDFFTTWTVEINSLEELNALAERHGDIIISVPHYRSNSPFIKIYDYYLE